ncbi:hypothetical protein SALBM311S_00512 [Streptomyces alboniger]
MWSMHIGRTEDLVTLADSGGSWRVCVACTGRAAHPRFGPEGETRGTSSRKVR